MVEGGVGEVDVVLLGHAVLGQAQAFAEISDLSKSPGAQCLQGFCGFFSGLKKVRTRSYLRNLNMVGTRSGNSV